MQGTGYLLVVTVAFALSANAGQIHPRLFSKLENREVLDVTVKFAGNNDIFESPALAKATSRDSRTSTMIQMLKDRLEENLKPFRSTFPKMMWERSVSKALWISGTLHLKAVDLSMVRELAKVPGDFMIMEQVQAHVFEDFDVKEVSGAEVGQNSTQWGVEMIQAPRVWNTTRGQGIVVGVIDTGVNVNHESLINAYACRNGSNVANCSGWLDPFYNEPEPTDVDGHGTHCIGSSVGRTNGIGVAPEAEWISCRGMNHQGAGPDEIFLECFQWMLAEANPRPHVISNSWGMWPYTPEDYLNDVLRALIAADIIPVFALGNSGPSCGSGGAPGNQPFNIAVGATQSTDTMASFSSRGPSSGGAILKPEVSAPGANIISASAFNPTGYRSLSGTSMACPHVAGAIALILSRNPNLNYYQVKGLLEATGDRPTVTQADRNCYPSGQEWPNNAFGHGRINVARALGVL